MTRPATQRPTARRRTRLTAAVAVVALGAALVTSACSSDGPDTSTTESTATTASPDTTGAPDTSGGDGAGGDTTATTVDPGEFAAPLADPAATGRELAQRFLDILGNPNPAPLLEEFLAPAFQIQRSNGTFANKEEYVAQPASVARFTIADEGFRAYQEGPALTVRFAVAIEEQINGEELRVTDADRLGVFIRTPRGWQLLAWSNFNPVPASPTTQ